MTVIATTDLMMEINQKRQVMFDAAKKYGRRSVETLKESQELDQLILQYQKNEFVKLFEHQKIESK